MSECRGRQESVDSLTGPDREFAYWLALRANVDRFEDVEP